ncbi:MAG: tyrosine-type recombinase/integrase [Thermoleophilia bacterium]
MGLPRFNRHIHEALYAYLLAEGRVRGQSGLSPSSVRRVHAALHRALRDAVRWGRLTANPAAAADPPKTSAEHDEPTVWSGEYLAAFLDSVRDDRLFALWRLLALTGMRRGESLGLHWEDVDLEAGTIAISRALIPVNGVAYVSEPKTKRGRRTIALDPETLRALQNRAARQLTEQRQWAEAWLDSDYVFTRQDGQALQPFAVSKIFQVLARNAALPRIRLRDLRHSYVTLALASGVNPRIVSGRLGHSTVALPWMSTHTFCHSRISRPPSPSLTSCGQPPENYQRADPSAAVTRRLAVWHFVLPAKLPPVV